MTERKRDKFRRLLLPTSRSPSSSPSTLAPAPLPALPAHRPSNVSASSPPTGLAATRQAPLASAQPALPTHGPLIVPSSLSPTGLEATPGSDGVFLNSVLCRLGPREREVVGKHIPATANGIDSILQGALKAAQDKHDLCAQRRWTFNFGDRNISLCEQAEGVIKWLDRFKQIGDVASNADPILVGLPWVGVRLLLEVR